MGRKKRPAITPQERENELIMLAYDVAEQRLRDGSASSQIVTQLLKLEVPGTNSRRLVLNSLDSWTLPRSMVWNLKLELRLCSRKPSRH